MQTDNDDIISKRGSYGWALYYLRLTYYLRRRSWHPEYFIWLEPGGMCMVSGCSTTPTFKLRTKDGRIHSGWLATHCDQLGDDWEIVPHDVADIMFLNR